MRKPMVALIAALVTVFIALAAFGRSPFLKPARIIHPKSGEPIVVPGDAGDSTVLFNGWKISPAGRPIATGDLPLGGAISPDGTTLAIANCGYNRHALHLIDVATEQQVAELPLARAWHGIACAPDGKRIYVAGGV